MRQILDFLGQLAEHNDRDWFAAHKAEYQACNAEFVDFTAQYIDRMVQIEPELAGLQPKDCIWRIYRDVRFSSDKRPYKHWFGTFLAQKGGKKSQRGGYYVHLQPGHCMFAAGIWGPGPELLKALRTEIEANYEEVEEIFARPDTARYFFDFDDEESLKKVPAGFDPNFVHADWLKRKMYILSTPLSDDEVCAPDFMDKAVDLAAAAKPMNDFLNYTFEEYGEFPPRC